MSIKSKVFAVAATMTMVGGVSAVGLLPADASTGSCGSACLSVFSQEFGSSFVFDVLRQGEKVGQPIILFRASNSDPAEDFTILDQGTVADYYTAGLVSEALDKNYGGDEGYEVEYSPYGVDSGLSIGVGSTAGDGSPVALEPCGASSKTVWVVDSYDSAGPTYYPWINGSDTNFSNPFVLHYPSNGYPTDVLRPQLNTYSLQEYRNTTPSSVYNNENWDGLAPATPTPPA